MTWARIEAAVKLAKAIVTNLSYEISPEGRQLAEALYSVTSPHGERCCVRDVKTKLPCQGSKPCPIHNPELYRETHSNPQHDNFAIGGDTLRASLGALELDVEWLRGKGWTTERIGQLWLDMSAIYRQHEMRELAPPQYGVMHNVHGWLINGGDRDGGPYGWHTYDVRLAQHFDTPGEVQPYLEEIGAIKITETHPNHTRWGYTILRIR